MKSLHSREEILQKAIRNAPTKAVGRIIQQQGATVSVGRNPFTGLPGWTVTVKAQSKTYYIRIDVDEEARKHRISYPTGWPTRDKEIKRELLL